MLLLSLHLFTHCIRKLVACSCASIAASLHLNTGDVFHRPRSGCDSAAFSLGVLEGGKSSTRRMRNDNLFNSVRIALAVLLLLENALLI